MESIGGSGRDRQQPASSVSDSRDAHNRPASAHKPRGRYSPAYAAIRSKIEANLQALNTTVESMKQQVSDACSSLVQLQRDDSCPPLQQRPKKEPTQSALSLGRSLSSRTDENDDREAPLRWQHASQRGQLAPSWRELVHQRNENSSKPHLNMLAQSLSGRRTLEQEPSISLNRTEGLRLVEDACSLKVCSEKLYFECVACTPHHPVRCSLQDDLESFSARSQARTNLLLSLANSQRQAQQLLEQSIEARPATSSFTLRGALHSRASMQPSSNVTEDVGLVRAASDRGASRPDSAVAPRHSNLWRAAAAAEAAEIERSNRMFNLLVSRRAASDVWMPLSEEGQSQPSGKAPERSEGQMADMLLQATTTTVSNKVEEACCICLDQMNEGDQVCLLRCTHRMHRPCLKAWLVGKSATVCPLCKCTSSMGRHRLKDSDR